MPIHSLAVLRSVWRGATIGRSLFNLRLEREAGLTGIIVDLAGGKASYLSTLKIDGTLVNLDRVIENKPTIVADIERTYPIASESADVALLFNALEHTYDHRHVVHEMHRILRPGGKALVYVPYLIPIHTHQAEQFFVDDFFRYSASSLRRILSDAGFSEVRIEPLGGAFLVIAELCGQVLPMTAIRTVFCLLALPLQQLERFRPRLKAEKFPLGYYVTARA